MAFFKITTAAAASVVPAAAFIAYSSSISTNSSSSSKSRSLFPSSLSTSIIAPHLSSHSRSFTSHNSLHMDTLASSPIPVSQKDNNLPELMTEFMVDMKCEGCVNAVKDKLVTVDGVKSVEIDLSNQVVRVLGTSPVKIMADALEQTGRKARLIGQGNAEDFLVSAAVSEFKGPDIFGVVRIAQVNMELSRIEANFSGLSPGKHAWSINEFGDLTNGAASTGKIFNPTNPSAEKPLGDLGTLDVKETGEAFFSGVKPMLRVVDLIGRAIVVYETEDKSNPGIAAAVIARSAGVGENYKKLCTCDGTTIWEANNTDFAVSKV